MPAAGGLVSPRERRVYSAVPEIRREVQLIETVPSGGITFAVDDVEPAAEPLPKAEPTTPGPLSARSRAAASITAAS